MRFDPRISIITLGVCDMLQSRKFYEDWGWVLSDQSNDSVSFFQGRGIVLGLYSYEDLAKDANLNSEEVKEALKFRGVSLAYNCASEAQVDDAFAHAISIGAKLIKAPEKAFWGGYSGYVSDRDDHLWEIAYNPFFAMDENGHLKLDGNKT